MWPAPEAPGLPPGLRGLWRIRGEPLWDLAGLPCALSGKGSQRQARTEVCGAKVSPTGVPLATWVTGRHGCPGEHLAWKGLSPRAWRGMEWASLTSTPHLGEPFPGALQTTGPPPGVNKHRIWGPRGEVETQGHQGHRMRKATASRMTGHGRHPSLKPSLRLGASPWATHSHVHSQL